MFEQAILHVDLDTFFVSVETLKDSRIRGKPVVVGGTAGRGVVLSRSEEAGRFGIQLGLPLRMALQRCPDLIVRRGDEDDFARYSDLVAEVIADRAPVYERAGIDNFYLDLTGLDRYFGAWQWARTLGAEIVSQTGLPLSLSLATNKLVAKVGANVGKPRVERLVPPGTERAFFAPLPVRQLPGVGRKTTHRLAQMGVRRLETLAGIPPELLLREFGPPGKKLWRQANARDTSRVIPHDAKRELRREHVLATDTTDATLLRRHLRRLALDLGYELRRNQRLTSQLTVKIVYVDRDTHVRRQRIAHTATDARLTAVADRLFVALFRRRQLVRAVGVKAGGLACGAPQLDLFGTDVRDQRLSAALDGIRNRFGQSLV